MKKTVRLTHESQVRANDVCTQHSDSFDVTPGAKKTRLALNDYVTESTRLLAILWQGGTRGRCPIAAIPFPSTGLSCFPYSHDVPDEGHVGRFDPAAEGAGRQSLSSASVVTLVLSWPA